MSKAIHATTATFDSEINQAAGPVLVDFWAAWCGPCRQVAPVLDQLQADHANLTVVKVDVDSEQELAMKFGITSIPALKLFVDGKVVKEVIGARPKAALEKEFAGYL